MEKFTPTYLVKQLLTTADYPGRWGAEMDIELVPRDAGQEGPQKGDIITYDLRNGKELIIREIKPDNVYTVQIVTNNSEEYIEFRYFNNVIYMKR